MPLVAPISQVRLMSVPFEIDYNHVIDFRASAGSGHPPAQTNYFLSLPSLQISDFMYIRQNQSIKVPFPKDQVMYHNYCMYKNNQFSDKWFYAFITDVQYINPNTSQVFLSTDVFQTYYFDLSFKTSFIEREHQNRWTTSGSPIFNLLPESLECGNMVRVIKTVKSESNAPTGYLVFSNHALSDSDVPSVDMIQKYPLLYTYSYFLSLNDSDLVKFYNAYGSDSSQLSSYIISITPYLGPTSAFFPTSMPVSNSYGLRQITHAYKLDGRIIANFTQSPSDFGFVPPSPGTGSGWAHEPKLLTYPYSFFELALPDGNSTIYQYEYLSTSGQILALSAISPFQKTIFYLSGSYIGVDTNPQAFVEANSNYDVGLISSAWTNYMASNKASLTLGTFSSLALGIGKIISSASSSNYMSAIMDSASLLSQISSTYAKYQDLKSAPASTSPGTSDFFIDMCFDNLYPSLYYKQIDTQFLQTIGDYFMKFGYKCNRVKIPNTLSRHRFNYLKTINCEFTGDIPQDDLSALKSIFDKGVTLWHDPSFFLDYSIDNTEQNRY